MAFFLSIKSGRKTGKIRILIILVTVKYDWGPIPEWPKILLELTQESARNGTPEPNRWKQRMSRLCQCVGWNPKQFLPMNMHRACVLALISSAQQMAAMFWDLLRTIPDCCDGRSRAGQKLSECITHRLGGVAIPHYPWFQGQRPWSYRVWKVALMSKTCKGAWPSVVINAPLPRAINPGFLGPVPTRLIALHLLKFPLTLTAAFSVLVRQC